MTMVREPISANLPDYNFMGKGWTFLHRKIDDYDVEWQTWKNVISNYWYCFLLHVVSAEIFRFMRFKVSDSVRQIDRKL